MDDVETPYQRLREAYQKAEDAISNLSIGGEGADTAAINELRYAGQHILRAITAQNEDVKSDEIRRAMGHCQRALYDAYDGAIYFLLDRYQQFKDDYATIPVLDVVPNFLDLERTMKKAKNFLKRARSESDDRASFYEEVQSEYREIYETMELLDASRFELNKLKIADRKKAKRFWAVLGIGFLGSIIGSLISATAIVFYRSSGS